MPTFTRRAVILKGALILTAIVLLVLLAGVVYLVVERISAGRELRAVKEKLTAEGILRPLSELAPPPSPEAVAQGEKFLAVIAALEPLTKADPDVRDGPEAMLMTAPGTASVTTQAPAPAFPNSKGATHPASWEELHQRLAPAVPILAEARQLLKSPVSYESDLTSFKSTIPAEHSQTLIVWLRANALLQLHDGNIPAAISDMEALAQNALFIGSKPSLIGYVLEMGMWQFGLNALFWEILQSPSLTEADLIRLDHIANTAPPLSKALRCTEIELARQPPFIHSLKTYPASEVYWAFSRSGDGILSTPQADEIRMWLWRNVWADRDEAMTLAYWSSEIQDTRTLFSEGEWIDARDQVPPEENLPPRGAWRFPWYYGMSNSNTVQGILRAAIKFETQRQLIRAAIALERYRLSHDAYPATLAELVPAYLPELPHDWYDGQPVKYHPPTSTTPYGLYSVGPDGIDNGGDPTPGKDLGNKRPFLTSGRDYVWPRPEKSPPPSETLPHP